MERNKTIEWQVLPDHIVGQKPLGYKVEIAEDDLFRRICFVHNTFSAADNFTYDDKALPSPHFVDYPPRGLSSPIIGQGVRLEYEPERLMKFLAASKGNNLQRVSPDGERIIDYLDTCFTGVIYLSVDELTNDIWLTTAEGFVASVPIPFNPSTIKTLPVGIDCFGCIPDGFRKVFWEITPLKLKLKTFGGQLVKEWDLSLTANSLMSAQVVSATGDCYLTLGSNDPSCLSDRFLVFCEFSGTLYEVNSLGMDETIGCISKWGSNCVLTGGNGPCLTKWNGNSGVVLADLTSIGVGSISAISAKYGETIYVVDSDDVMVAINPATYAKLWEKQLPSQNVKRIGAMFGSSGSGRPILFCDDDSAGLIRDFISEGVVMSGVQLQGSGASVADFGHTNKVAIAHIRISPLYERLGVVIESSSSSSNSSSTLSESSVSSSSSMSSVSSESSTRLSLTTTSTSTISTSSSTRVEFDSSVSSSSSFEYEEGRFMALGGMNGYYAISQDYGGTWTKKEFMSSTAKPTLIMSSSAKHQTVLANSSDTTSFEIWVSNSFGSNWVKKNETIGLNSIGGLVFLAEGSCSSDGRHQMFSFRDNYSLNTINSNDFGQTWNRTVIADTGTPLTTLCLSAMSKDGRHRIIGSANKYFYESTDYGSSWSSFLPSGLTGTNYYYAFNGSSDLSVLAILGYGGDVLISRNNGRTWTKTLDLAVGFRSDYRQIGMSENGQYIAFIAGASSSQGWKIRVSRNFGSSWTDGPSSYSGFSGEYGGGISISKSGEYMLAGCYSGSYHKAYVSDDYGVTWSIKNSPQMSNLFITNTAISTGVDYQYTSSLSSENMSSLGHTSSSFSSSYFDDVTMPAQTSGTSPFIVTADSEVSGTGDAWRAFDHKAVPVSNTTGVNCWRTSSTDSRPHWIMIDFGETNKKTIQHYNIHCSAHVSSTYPQQLYIYSPTGWVFQGSNDGETFDSLDYRQLSDSEWGPSTANKYYSFSNSTPYRYYRLYVMYVHKGTGATMPNMVQIEELRYSE